jgi:O-acetyl-ADP-ribose deacetylase (regulator of RNase III)
VLVELFKQSKILVQYIEANELGIKSIAFPVMEPPTFHISKSIIATIMIVAIRTFLKENKTLTAVHITIPDTQTLNLFKWALT